MSSTKKALTELLDAVESGVLPIHNVTFHALETNDMEAIRAFHGSLDAAKALHDAVLPEWVVNSIIIWGKECRVEILETHTRHDGQWHGSKDACAKGKSENAARAWLIAILKALIAQEGE